MYFAALVRDGKLVGRGTTPQTAATEAERRTFHENLEFDLLALRE